MPTDTTTQNITEDIRGLFDTQVGHFADKSARWLFRQKENVQGLIKILAEDLEEHLDFQRLTLLNRSFVDDTLRDLQSDMVFSVPFRDATQGEDVTVYILIEHQSTVDRMMGFRLLFYMCQIWNEQRRTLERARVPKSRWRLRPIIPIVYYTGSQRWETPLSLSTVMDVPEVLSRFVPRFDTLFLGVKETDPEALTKTDHLLGWLLRVLQEDESDVGSLYDALQATLRYLDTLPAAESVQHKNAILYLYHLILFRRPETEREGLIQLIQSHTTDTEVRNIIMTGAEALIEQGIEQGVEQGAREMLVHNIFTVLSERFSQAEVESVRASLETVSDLTMLNELFRIALHISSVEVFLNTIDTTVG